MEIKEFSKDTFTLLEERFGKEVSYTFGFEEIEVEIDSDLGLDLANKNELFRFVFGEIVGKELVRRHGGFDMVDTESDIFLNGVQHDCNFKVHPDSFQMVINKRYTKVQEILSYNKVSLDTKSRKILKKHIQKLQGMLNEI